MPEITEEIAHIKGIPKKLVVFLHGYIDSDTGLDKILANFEEKLTDCALHIPQAPLVCEIHDKRRQWYSMHEFDPDDARKYVPTLKECTDIYNRMTKGFDSAYTYLTPYIDNLLNEYQLQDKDLYLCGFSQGAMLAIYTALMRDKKIGGCVSFSGIMAPYSYLEKHTRSRPKFLLIHGDNDNLVRFEALDFTKQELEKIQAPVTTYVVKGGQHRNTEDALDRALKFIRARKKE